MAPLLSIVVPVYNHAAYIEECIASILAQETSFPIEVLIGEDCSTDDTRAILKRLEATLPDYVTIFYRDENLGAVCNGEDLYSRATGAYLAELEGDDFYLDRHKLQKQVDFLEAHPEYVATYTNCRVVGADSQPTGEGYPECKDDDYSLKEYFYWCLPGQTGTVVCRRAEYLAARDSFLSMKSYRSYPGDRRNAFLLLTMGNVRCFQEQMGAYRHITTGGSSHSANIVRDEAFARNEVGFGETLVRYAQAFGSERALLTAKCTLYRMRFRWSFGPGKINSWRDILRDIAHEPSHRASCALAFPCWCIGLFWRLVRGRAIT